MVLRLLSMGSQSQFMKRNAFFRRQLKNLLFLLVALQKSGIFYWESLRYSCLLMRFAIIFMIDARPMFVIRDDELQWVLHSQWKKMREWFHWSLTFIFCIQPCPNKVDWVVWLTEWQWNFILWNLHIHSPMRNWNVRQIYKFIVEKLTWFSYASMLKKILYVKVELFKMKKGSSMWTLLWLKVLCTRREYQVERSGNFHNYYIILEIQE